VTNKCC